MVKLLKQLFTLLMLMLVSAMIFATDWPIVEKILQVTVVIYIYTIAMCILLFKDTN